MKAIFSVIAALFIGTRLLPGAPLLTVRSPDGAVELKLVTQARELYYHLTFHGRQVIESSPLRFSIDDVSMTSLVDSVATSRYRVNETYPWCGVHGRATNHANGAAVRLSQQSSGLANCTLEVRAYDDGAAFRFLVEGNDSMRIPREATSFILPQKSQVWYHDLVGHYEGIYTHKEAGEVRSEEWAAPPMTVQLPHGGGYAVVTEAALTRYSGIAFQSDGHGQFHMVAAENQPVSYPYRLRYSAEDIRRLSRPAEISGPIVTPWRVVIIGKNLNALVNSDLVPNLCPPPDPEIFPQGMNTPWIKPGRAVWKYLDGGEGTPEGTKQFCKLAAQLGFEYNVVEGYWSRWSAEELKDVAAYARQCGVGLFFWKHSKSLRTAEAREAFFGQMESLGIAGAKIDFFDHEHKEVIDLYQAILETAARHHVLLDFHGSNKPTGEARPWPNELNRESVKGMEASKIEDRATHDATLPFTRFVAGHADYTPVHFGARRGNTTWSHQIATAAVFTAPLLTYAVNPETLLAHPARDMIKSIPATWDETLVLPGSEIGKVALFARRAGPVWFLAAVNGNAPRTMTVPLSFLKKGAYDGLLVRDDPADAVALKIESRHVQQRERLVLNLSAGGGFIGRFRPLAHGR